MQGQIGAEASGLKVSAADEAIIQRAILRDGRRIEKIELSDFAVWIKRQGAERSIRLHYLHSSLFSLLRYPFMRPSLVLDAHGMNTREADTIATFSQNGFVVPEIIYRSSTAIVVKDVGRSIAARLKAIRDVEPLLHEAIIVQAVEALGELHAAGLCHGRPHLRDFFLKDGRIGFLDFEERPQEVMPLATAQARDLWLLLLTSATISLDVQNTYQKAFAAWRLRAPEAAQAELRKMITVLGRFLPIVRLIGRVRMGSDLRRFILATEFLKTAVETDAASGGAGKAGKDDRT